MKVTHSRCRYCVPYRDTFLCTLNGTKISETDGSCAQGPFDSEIIRNKTASGMFHRRRFQTRTYEVIAQTLDKRHYILHKILTWIGPPGDYPYIMVSVDDWNLEPALITAQYPPPGFEATRPIFFKPAKKRIVTRAAILGTSLDRAWYLTNHGCMVKIRDWHDPRINRVEKYLLNEVRY